MRDIKFRGQRDIDGVWVYGLPKETIQELSEDGVIHALGDFHNVDDIDIKTLGQFTNSHVNGEELYDGDIVRCYSSDDWHSKFDYLLEIKWCDFDKGGDAYSETKGWGAFRRNSGFASTGLGHIRKSYAGVNFEIIGNIHENPDLIPIK